VLAFIGSIYGVKLIWDISDLLIGLMIFPNIIGLIVLRRNLGDVTRSAMSSGEAD
jgi:AGCS family alanine or glycine:cation symporter